jgi:hypothetical protein
LSIVIEEMKRRRDNKIYTCIKNAKGSAQISSPEAETEPGSKRQTER